RTFRDGEKWAFSEQVYVDITDVNDRAGQLGTPELRAQYRAALLDVMDSTYYTRMTSGANVTYSWKSKDGVQTYTLSEERVVVTPAAEAEGGTPGITPPVYSDSNAKWGFSAQFRVQKGEVASHVNDLESEYRNAYAAALRVPSEAYFRTVSGADTSYSWTALDKGVTYSLSCSPEKVYVPATEVVDGVVRIKTDAAGKVIYETTNGVFDTEILPKWIFSEQVVVPKETVHANIALLETDAVRAQAYAALDGVDAVAAFTRTLSGTATSFSWESLTGGKTFGLNCDATKVMTSEAPLPVYADGFKWTFNETSLALRSDVEAQASHVPADQRQQYDVALADTDDHSAYFTRSLSGTAVNYSWRSLGGVKTYSLAIEQVKTGDVLTPAKWTMSVQTRVRKSEVEKQVKEFKNRSMRQQYLDALDLDDEGNPDETTNDVDDATVYTKTEIGSDVSYSWKNLDNTATFSLNRSLQRISDAAGNLAGTRIQWTFSKQVLVTGDLVDDYAGKIENGAVRTQYADALNDVDMATEY
ncbi:MAG TPA: hypothetical protein PLY30_03740, partial [Candidatus Omnitrophota bacterium]|nr:hypothetical protein [Candidatus Omnitrophota bacterium]